MIHSQVYIILDIPCCVISFDTYIFFFRSSGLMLIHRLGWTHLYRLFELKGTARNSGISKRQPTYFCCWDERAALIRLLNIRLCHSQRRWFNRICRKYSVRLLNAVYWFMLLLFIFLESTRSLKKITKIYVYLLLKLIHWNEGSFVKEKEQWKDESCFYFTAIELNVIWKFVTGTGGWKLISIIIETNDKSNMLR